MSFGRYFGVVFFLFDLEAIWDLSSFPIVISRKDYYCTKSMELGSRTQQTGRRKGDVVLIFSSMLLNFTFDLDQVIYHLW